MNEIEKLRNEIDAIDYPENITQKIKGEIDGPGFFPGAWGNPTKLESISNLPYMVLGQDQDNEKGFEKSKKTGNEEYTRTWSEMEKLFNKAGISLSDCFITNALMGIRINAKSNSGPSPSLQDQEFVTACAALLQTQIETQKPKAIICLGIIPLHLLGLISFQLRTRLVGLNGFKDIDARGLGYISELEFDGMGNFSSALVSLTHPSYRFLNSSGRRFEGKTGDDAEIALLDKIKNKYET